jgi:hypothetical protein
MKILFLLLFITLPIGGFVLGAVNLREFGARLSNFLMLASLVIILLEGLKRDASRNRILVGTYGKISILIIFFVTLNFLVLLILNIEDKAIPIELIKGFLQYLLVLWFFISVYIWVKILDKINIYINYHYFIKVLLISTAFNLAIFILDMVNQYSQMKTISDLLFFFRGNISERVSGLATEPSMFASWALMIWPLLIFQKRESINILINKLSILFGLGCIAASIISGARTFLIVFLIQLGVFFAMEFRSKNGGFLRRSCLMIALSTVIFYFLDFEYYLLQVFSIVDIEGSISSITRLGLAITAFNVFLGNIFFGIGIGQFTFNFSSYVPDWALASTEVIDLINGVGEYRVNTYNLFLRIGAELGLGVFILFCYLIIKVFKDLIFLFKKTDIDKFWLRGVLLSVIGAISFWFQQDLFSYQPGIFSIGLTIYLVRLSKRI